MRFVAVEFGLLHRGLDARQQSGEVAQHHVVDGAFDGAARGVPENHDDLCAGNRAPELHAAEDVVVEHIAGNTGVEHVADAQIEDHLDRLARVEATQDDAPASLGNEWGVPDKLDEVAEPLFRFEKDALPI